MKAVVNYENGEKKVRLMDVAVPEPAPGQVRIRVSYCGICGTDIHIFTGDGGYPTNPPVTMGHELSGVVESVGEGVDPAWIGEKVVSETYYYTCGTCFYCQTGHSNLCLQKKSIGSAVNGAMAEYVVVPAKNLHKIPEGVTMKEAAMTEPLACCTQGVLEFGGLRPGDKVLLTGPGAIGLMCLQLAVSAGATVIVAGTAVDKDRMELARELGASEIVYSDQPDAEEKIASAVSPLRTGRCVRLLGRRPRDPDGSPRGAQGRALRSGRPDRQAHHTGYEPDHAQGAFRFRYLRAEARMVDPRTDAA